MYTIIMYTITILITIIMFILIIIMLESNPLKSRFFVCGLAVTLVFIW